MPQVVFLLLDLSLRRTKIHAMLSQRL